MTPRERAKEATWETGCPDWSSDEHEQLETAVEQAIIAAVADATAEEARKYIAEVRRQVEQERGACAKIAEQEREIFKESFGALVADQIANKIRARSTNSPGGAK